MQLTTETTNSFLGKYYWYIALAVVVSVFGFGGFFLLWPQYQSLQNSGVLEYQSAVNTLKTRQQYLFDLQTMTEHYNELDQRLVRSIDLVLPEYRDTEIVFEELELLFANSGVKIQSMNIASSAETAAAEIEAASSEEEPVLTEVAETTTEISADPVAALKNIEKINVTVNLASQQSSYEQFKTFLTTLEQHDHLIELESMAFSPTTEGMTLVFSTYQQTINPHE